MRRSRSPRELARRQVSVLVPASSANLGVGYDVLALALELHLEVSIEAVDAGEHVLEVDGEGAGRLAVDDSNRFLTGFWRGLLDAGARWPGALHVRMRNDIPLGRGLGSSAAATVAGLLAAGALAGTERDDERLLAHAAEIEGHAENAAASLHGGFVACAAGRVVRYDPPPGLRAAVLVPDRELATAEMRAALPQTVAHADAVHNLGRAAMLVSAFASGDQSLLWAMNEDRLHEPYRAAVYPELPELLRAARDAGAVGAALSGAGSSVIALCRDDATTTVVAAALTAAARLAGLAGSARILVPAAGGAQVLEGTAPAER
ncbi:MAG TPA: homoserine kinase [Candidatus Limnocylindrales bacterium]|nr:homoserine kinase [Candidatus Limnocylindrales bacterium]